VPPRSKWRRLEIDERAGQRRFSTSGVIGCRRPISVLVLPQRCPAPSSGQHSGCPGHPVARPAHPAHGRRAVVSQRVRNPSDGPILQHLFRTRILRRWDCCTSWVSANVRKEFKFAVPAAMTFEVEAFKPAHWPRLSISEPSGCDGEQLAGQIGPLLKKVAGVRRLSSSSVAGDTFAV